MLDLTIVAISLFKRGFWQPGHSAMLDQLRTFLGVENEVGETAKVFRVALEVGALPDLQKQFDEAADIYISATNYLLTACGSVEAAEKAVRAKMARDEARGFQHRGGPLLNEGPM
jgi:NTP pyrophosphatase (non-canonical NTP hydrolase)